MAKAKQRSEWDQTSLLWCMLANANRDDKKHPQPFTPADVHPFRTREDYETEESGAPDWALIGQLKRQHKVTKLKRTKGGEQ